MLVTPANAARPSAAAVATIDTIFLALGNLILTKENTLQTGVEAPRVADPKPCDDECDR
jgi:hypothetical protein